MELSSRYQALRGSSAASNGGRLLRCWDGECGGGWASALAEHWANCRMFTLQRGTGLIITAGPGHIKGLRKGQTFCWSATVSRPLSTPAHTHTQKADCTHMGTHPLGISTSTKTMVAHCKPVIYLLRPGKARRCRRLTLTKLVPQSRQLSLPRLPDPNISENVWSTLCFPFWVNLHPSPVTIYSNPAVALTHCMIYH